MVQYSRFALVAMLLWSAWPLAQVQAHGADSPYVLRIRRVTDGKDACVLLQRDGHYHFERILANRALVYEGSVSPASLKELQLVMGHDELLLLTQSSIPLHLYSGGWDEVDLLIARNTGWQQLRFPDAESRKAVRQSLDPLLNWFQGLPTENRTGLSEEESKNNCLPPRPEDPKLATREKTTRTAPVQAASSFPDPYLLRIVFDRLSPTEGTRTCAIVYPNGFYHLEKSREKHDAKGIYRPDIVIQGPGGRIEADVFEQFLDSTTTAELRKILDDPSLAASRHTTLPAGTHYTDAEITMAFIPRAGLLQQLAFTNYFEGDHTPTAYGRSPHTQHIDRDANLLSPLQKWIKSNIESHKAARLKEAFGNNCTSVPAQVLPTEITRELAEVVPSDLDALSTETGPPTTQREARLSGSSVVPSPVIAKEDVDELSPAGSETAISLRATTRMVLLDLIATEKNGTPVTDLRPGDIRVLEDGRPQNLKFFSRVSNDLVAERPGHAQPQLPPGVYTNRPEYSQAEGPLVLLLLDGINTSGTDQAYARQQLLQYVRTLKADQRVALFALSTDLLLLQDFTSDPQVLKAALESYTPKDSFLLARGLPDQISPQMEKVMGLSAALQNLIRANQENAVNAADARVHVTLAALDSIARAMIGYSGRKNLIWVSSGFPVSIQLWDQNLGLSRNYAPESIATAKRLSQAQVAVYPVDARGLIGKLQDLPKCDENPCRDQIVPTVRSPETATYGTQEVTRIAPLVADSHLAMEEMAQDTGGRAFYEVNNLTAAVAAAVADGSSYYALGYYPDHQNWNGDFRKISIQAERQDIRLRYRPGYYASDSAQLDGPPAERKQGDMQEVLRASAGPLPATGVSFWARLVPPGTGDSATYVEFLVDANTISCVDAGSHHDCNLDFVAFTVAPNGTILSTVAKNTQMPLPAPQYTSIRKKGLPYRMQINSLPEHGSLRLAVRDNRAGLFGTLTIPISSSSLQVGVSK